MYQEIKKIDPVSMAKIYGITLAIFGLFLGLCLSLLSLIGGSMMADEMGVMGVAFGASAIIVIPLFYGVMGFLAGIIGAAIYNVVAKMVGGLLVEFSTDDEIPLHAEDEI